MHLLTVKTPKNPVFLVHSFTFFHLFARFSSKSINFVLYKLCTYARKTPTLLSDHLGSIPSWP